MLRFLVVRHNPPTMKRGFELSVTNPPHVGTDIRPSDYQQGMQHLIGPQGYLPSPWQQDTRQFSSVPIPSMSVPASTAAGIPNPRIEQLGAAPMIEFKTIFAANSGDLEVLLGANGVSPLTPTSSSAFIMEQIRVNSHLPDQVPERGRVRSGTLQRQQRVGRLSSYGVGFEMPVRAYMDRDGPMYLRIIIEQMSLGMIDFMILLVYNMLLNAFDYGLDGYIKEMNKRGLNTRLRYVDWLERDHRFLGALQREEHPIETIMNYVDDQQRLIGQKPDVLLVNHRLVRFMHNIRAYTEFFRAGPGGPPTVGATYGASLAARLNIAVHVVRANVIDDEGEFDFMTQYRRYGEFVPMITQHTSSDTRPYQTRWLDTWIMDARTDTWQRVTLRDALLASGRWGRDGKLVDINGFSDFDGAPANDDPFHHPVNGKLEPIKFWGQLPNVNAKAYMGDMDIINTTIRTALNTLKQYAEKSRNAPHDEAFVKSILALGTKPAQTKMPPYVGTAYGLRMIAEEYAVTIGTENVTEAITAALKTIDDKYQNQNSADVVINLAIGANFPQILITDTKITEPGFGGRTLVSLASPIRIGELLQISNGPRSVVEAGVLAEASGRLGLAGDRNVVAARNLLTNYGYTNAANPAGVHTTDYMRGLMLGGLQHVSTDGAPTDVSARIGAYMDWLHSKGFVSPSTLSAPSEQPATVEQTRQFATHLRAFMESDVGKNVFGTSSTVATTLRSVAAQATNTTVADVASRLGASAHIGAMAVDTVRGEESIYQRYDLQWTAKQLPGYLAVVDDAKAPPTCIKFTDPARPGEVAAVHELREILRLPAIEAESRLRSDARNISLYGRQMATKLAELTKQANNLGELAMIADFMTTSTDWPSVEQMLRENKPIPVTPILMRWRGVISTAGMIAAQRRSALTAYGFPRVSSTTDDGHMQTRLTSLFEAGAFITNDKSVYHIHDIMITGISENGMNADFATREGLHNELEGGDPTGSIVCILDTNYDPHAQKEAISAYGSWAAAGVMRPNLADLNAAHFSGVDWMRKYWGVSPPQVRSLDPFNDVRGDFLTMWRGAACSYDPVKDRRGKIQRGCGPIASGFFYDSGMFGAWNRGTAYPAQSQVKAIVS